MNIRGIALVLLVLAAGCSGGAPPTVEPSTAETASDPGLAPGEHVGSTADGVAMAYTVAGDADVTVVLIHCWMCDRTYWTNQVPVLAERYRVIAVDLPGHGEAGTDRTTWTVAGLGDDVAALLADLDLADVVLVGHSMGGPVALRAAAQAPARVRGIVAVDTLQDAERDFSGEEVERVLAMFREDYVGVCGRMVHQMFPEDGVESIESYVRDRACAPERAPIGIALMNDFTTIDMDAWFSAAGVPIRAVNAAGPNPTRIEINLKYADYDAVLLEGVGHYLHMTRPGEFNPLLVEAIEDVLHTPG